MQYPCSPEHSTSRVYPMCVYTLLLWLSHVAFNSVICNDSIYLLWAGLVPMLLGQSGITWGLSWVRPGICQSCSSTKLQGVLMLFQEAFFGGWDHSQTRCLLPVHYWGSSSAGVTLQWCWPLQSWGCLHNARLVAPLNGLLLKTCCMGCICRRR